MTVFYLLKNINPKIIHPPFLFFSIWTCLNKDSLPLMGFSFSLVSLNKLYLDSSNNNIYLDGNKKNAARRENPILV